MATHEEAYDLCMKLDDMTLAEAHAALEPNADPRSWRKRQRESGRLGGKARAAAHPAAERHTRIGSSLPPDGPRQLPRRAAKTSSTTFRVPKPAGNAPRLKTVYDVLRRDKSWKRPKPKIRC